jgi:hypothetical protein
MRLSEEVSYCSRKTRERHALPPSSGIGNLAAVFESIASDVPDANWQRVPVDLSKNLDHFLYSTQTTS